jgi:competence protein ComFA
LKQGLPIEYGEFLKETCGEADSRILVFVPTVAQAQPTSIRVSRLLGELRSGGDAACDFSHANDPAREHKIDQFRQGKIRVLVTTSILERGVTIPHLHVIVNHADHPVFDWAALVQMAGRAGRSSEHPLDRVLFVAGTTSGEVKRAVRHIRQLNDEARAMGYLKDGW